MPRLVHCASSSFSKPEQRRGMSNKESYAFVCVSRYGLLLFDIAFSPFGLDNALSWLQLLAVTWPHWGREHRATQIRGSGAQTGKAPRQSLEQRLPWAWQFQDWPQIRPDQTRPTSSAPMISHSGECAQWIIAERVRNLGPLAYLRLFTLTPTRAWSTGEKRYTFNTFLNSVTSLELSRVLLLWLDLIFCLNELLLSWLPSEISYALSRCIHKFNGRNCGLVVDLNQLD